MQLYIIRHAQSENNVILERNGYASEDGRVADPKITVMGREQAKLLGEYLTQGDPQAEIHGMDMQNRRGFDLTHLYCSFMERSVQTGAILAERLGLPLTALVDLHELGGIYLEELMEGELRETILHGRNAEYFREHYPILQFEDFPREGWWPGGKEPRELWQPRAQRLLDLVWARHGQSEDRVALITHAGFTAMLFRCLLNINPDPNEAAGNKPVLLFNNCAISRFDLLEGRLFFIYHNRADFLPSQMLT
jgi:2,3-bisphosphoglycerate-dependent phosphoglycerate mutase